MEWYIDNELIEPCLFQPGKVEETWQDKQIQMISSTEPLPRHGNIDGRRGSVDGSIAITKAAFFFFRT